MRTRLLTDEEYEEVLNAKSFNPMRGLRTPESEEAFSDEFHAALERVERFAEERWLYVPPGDPIGTKAFHIYPAHNWTRVIGVEFSHELFLWETGVRDFQEMLRSLPEKWLVELSGANTLFVTPDAVFAHLPVAELLPPGISVKWLKDHADASVSLPLGPPTA